jgi:hypothetical protein
MTIHTSLYALNIEMTEMVYSKAYLKLVICILLVNVIFFGGKNCRNEIDINV